MGKFVHISKLLALILSLSFVIGQSLPVKIDDELFYIQQKDSIESFLLQQLYQKGAFGGKLVLDNGYPNKLSYQFINNVKNIDSITFNPSIPINQEVLEKIFSPLYKLDHVKLANNYVNYIRSAYPFIPNNLGLMYGRTDENKLRVLINFHPEFNSHISGIIGGGRNTLNSWVYTGELEVHLENTFQQASITDLNWKRQNEKSQWVYFLHEEPFLFRLPFGSKVEFSQDFREDEYIENQYRGALSFILGQNGKWYFGGSKYILNSTDDGDSAGIKDYRTQSIFVQYTGDKRDNRLLPTRGLFWDLKTDFGQLADGNKERFIFRINLLTDQYLKITRRFTIQLKEWGRITQSENQVVHRGELVRFGGMYSVRGYLEDAFMSEGVFISTASVIYSSNKNIQLFSFVDGSVAKNIAHDPYSFGVGYRQLSDNSFIEISFGWPGDEPFSAGKVHVKFTSLLD